MSVDPSKLPPLNSLKAFDAVARYANMSKAAAALNIAPSSVTQHLRKLEAYIGVKLLTRTANSIALTQEGKRYSAAVRPAFDILAAATSSLLSQEDDEPLRVSCVPTLGNSWFAAQLAALEERMPGVSIQCDFSPVPVNFDRDHVDFAIRYGAGTYPDADSEPLFLDKLAPVCTPLTARLIKNAHDLLKIARLSSPDATAEGHSMWYYWANACYGPEFAQKIDGFKGSVLNSSRFIVEALKVGESVAIIDHMTASPDLRRGLLVAPLGQWVDAPYGYHLLTPKRRMPRVATKQLKALLKKTADLLKPPQSTELLSHRTTDVAESCDYTGGGSALCHFSHRAISIQRPDDGGAMGNLLCHRPSTTTDWRPGNNPYGSITM
ncbi:LysR substrate-binding domain-containing protein [Mesorhizobium sp. M0663]|uniref:LysR substrate-binding domain-containing protein n=1 Tax=Mesorhizobium sp. M0663 TaxID=2956981 RepID=UPI003338F420